MGAAMDLPSDILALIFMQNGLDRLSGLKDRCSCSLVCRYAFECQLYVLPYPHCVVAQSE